MPRGRPTEIPEDVVLDAARDLLLRNGLRVTTAEIAARAGVSEGLLFYRYRTKDALLVAVLKREHRVPPRLEELAAAAGQGSLRENLEEIAGLLLAGVRSIHPLIELLHTSRQLPRLRRLMSGSDAGPTRLQAAVARYLAGEIAAGRLRRVDPALMASVLFGAVLDHLLAAQTASAGAGAGDDRGFLSGLADLLLRGALPDAAGRRAPEPHRTRSP